MYDCTDVEQVYIHIFCVCVSTHIADNPIEKKLRDLMDVEKVYTNVFCMCRHVCVCVCACVCVCKQGKECMLEQM